MDVNLKNADAFIAATVIGVGTLMMLARAGTKRFAVISIPATRTHNQALQQILGPSLGHPSTLTVFLQLLGSPTASPAARVAAAARPQEGARIEAERRR